MTPRERAAGALPPEDSSPWVAAQAGAAMHSAAPAPQPTAGTMPPELPGVAVTIGGWAAGLTIDKAHYVPKGAPVVNLWYSRPIAMSLDGWNALVDELGYKDGAKLPPCLTCSRALARLSAPAELEQQ